MTPRRNAFFVLTLGLAYSSLFAQAGPSLMENLGRGLVAVRTDVSAAYVGWRLLGTDPEDVAFNLYRSTNGGLPQKLNQEPIVETTDFVDASAPMVVGTYAYFVRPVVNGKEQDASVPFFLSASALPQEYIRVPLQVPPGGVSGGSSFTYNANDATVGDLDGDGIYEIVLKWEPSNARDAAQSGFTGPTIFDAYKLDGTRLWRIELGVNSRSGPHDTPFIVYDLDGDGRAEVALKTAPGTRDGLGNFVADPEKFSGEFPTEEDPNNPGMPFSHEFDYRNSSGRPLAGPEFMTIFDGMTGEELTSTSFFPERHPDTNYETLEEHRDIWGDNFGNRQARIYPPGVAYLDGHRPSLVWGRGYAGGQQGHPGRIGLGAWNWRDGELTRLWTFDSRGHPNESLISGQGGHTAVVADLDGDGRDEIVYGQLWLNHDGTLRYTGWGHGDALHVSNMDPDRPGQHVFQPHEAPSLYGPNALSYVDGKTGDLIWGVSASGDIGRGVAADIDPRFRGYEMWGSGSTGGLYSAQQSTPDATNGPRGAQVSPTKPNSINHVVWWDGDLLRELLDHATISKWNWVTESTNVLLSPSGIASNNGTKGNPCLQADILGDWREEVIWRESNNAALRIYTTTVPASNRLYTLMHDRQYREAIVSQNVGYNQPPHPSFFLGDGMAPQPRPDIIVEPDTTPPVIHSVTASPDVLWPANHQMRTVTIDAVVTDDVDPDPVTMIIDVSSNEPEQTDEAGDRAPDWEIIDELTLGLRAERLGSGTGRVYTITVGSVDFFGNTSTAATTVTVPHNR